MIAIFIILLASEIAKAKIIINEKPQILANYVKYVFENLTKQSEGYVGIVIINNNANYLEKSLMKIHQSNTNSIFLINFDRFEKNKYFINKVRHIAIYQNRAFISVILFIFLS